MIDQIWINGKWLESAKANISSHDRGFLLGDSCFETLLFLDGEIQGKAEHISLLGKSISVLQIENCINDEVLFQALTEAQQRLIASGVHEASVRVTLSRGEGRGTVAKGKPNLVIQMTELVSGRPYPPLNLITSNILRNETSPLSRIKAGCYGDHLAALRFAKSKGGNEALMLNTQRHVAGLAMGNIALVTDETVITPPAEDGVRAGFMRADFLSRVVQNGYSIEERSIKPDELIKSGATIFGLNSLWGVRPVASIDGLNLPMKQMKFLS